MKFTAYSILTAICIAWVIVAFSGALGNYLLNNTVPEWPFLINFLPFFGTFYFLHKAIQSI